MHPGDLGDARVQLIQEISQCSLRSKSCTLAKKHPLYLYFFLHNGEGSRRPQDFHLINIGRYNICSKVLAFIALDHQLIGKRTLQLFTNTPELQK
jgi:hypothetical protein